MNRWYVARTKAGQENIALRELVGQGYETYLPMLTRRRDSGRHCGQEYTSPLFTGYLFVVFDNVFHRWKQINSTRGVVHLLPQRSEEPEPVPEGLVELLQTRVVAGEFAVGLVQQVLLGFLEDDPVLIRDGVWRGRVGRFKVQAGNIVILFLSLLGREFVVDVPVEFVAPPP